MSVTRQAADLVTPATAGFVNTDMAGSVGTCRLRFGPEVAAVATLKANAVMRVHKAF